MLEMYTRFLEKQAHLELFDKQSEHRNSSFIVEDSRRLPDAATLWLPISPFSNFGRPS